MNRETRAKLIFILIGLTSLIWFLIRVIPKPSRATYPCMRAAFPVASGVVIYLLSVTSSWIAWRSIRQALDSKRFVLAFAFLLLAVGAFSFGMLLHSDETKASIISVAAHPPNEPMGEAIGIFPGQVVWVWDRFATNEHCTNTVNRNGILDDGDDCWFQDKNTDQLLVTQMISTGIQRLTGQNTDQASWDAIFRFHNDHVGKGDYGYREGEKILIKLNRTSTNSTSNLNVNNMKRNDKYNRTMLSETSPQIVLAVLRHLVHKANVPEHAIYVGDPMRNHYQEEYEKYHAEFPGVHYLGTNIYQTGVKILANGRTPVGISEQSLLFYADQGSDMPNAISDRLYSIYEDIDYLINLPMMKGHETGGVTIFPKNHFGSQARSTAMHLHPGLVDDRTGYGRYRVQVDIMGSEFLGKKNLVYILDALYPGPDWGDDPVKFEMPPFNDDWPSSVFFSFDPVAIESVAFDFLRTEFNGQNKYTSKAFPNIAGCDDYLHQAASETHWPEGIVYAPDAGKSKIQSLGVHEHWNNPEDKMYSRNLGTGEGIELVQELIDNHSPYLVREFDDFVIRQLNEEVVLVDNLDDYFTDYENDPVFYAATSSNEAVVLTVAGNTLSALLKEPEPANTTIYLEANDGLSSYVTPVLLSYYESVGVREIASGFHVYPNPVRDNLHLEFEGSYPNGCEVRIYDLSGRMKSLYSIDPAVKRFSFGVDYLQHGTFILEVSHGQVRESMILIKQ
jgi:hypothetical protein